MGDIDIRELTEEELDNMLVEIVMKMSPEQLEKAADMVLAAKEEVKGTKEAS